MTDARYAAIGILDDRRESLERFLTVGIDEDLRPQIGDLPTGRGVLGELIRDVLPLRVSDVGKHPASYGFPPRHPPMHSFLGVPIMIRGEAFGNLYLTEKQGGKEFDRADEDAVVILADWAAIAIENARLYREAEVRRGELEVAVGRLRAATEIMRALEGETDIRRVLELVVKRARALVGARWTAMLLVSGDELEIEEIAGDVDRTEVGTRVPIEGSVSGQVLKSRRPEICAATGATAMPTSTASSAAVPHRIIRSKPSLLVSAAAGFSARLAGRPRGSAPSARAFR